MSDKKTTRQDCIDKWGGQQKPLNAERCRVSEVVEDTNSGAEIQKQLGTDQVR